MKTKVIPKTEIQPTRTRLIVFLFSIMFAEYILGCFQPPALIPAALSGKYSTTHPRYKGQFFVLRPTLITLGSGDGELNFYKVIRVKKEIIEHRILYTVLCGNEDLEEEFNFAFFPDFDGKGIIHFKNKPQVSWEKHGAPTAYNDNSET